MGASRLEIEGTADEFVRLNAMLALDRPVVLIDEGCSGAGSMRGFAEMCKGLRRSGQETGGAQQRSAMVEGNTGPCGMTDQNSKRARASVE